MKKTVRKRDDRERKKEERKKANSKEHCLSNPKMGRQRNEDRQRQGTRD